MENESLSVNSIPNKKKELDFSLSEDSIFSNNSNFYEKKDKLITLPKLEVNYFNMWFLILFIFKCSILWLYQIAELIEWPFTAIGFIVENAYKLGVKKVDIKLLNK